MVFIPWRSVRQRLNLSVTSVVLLSTCTVLVIAVFWLALGRVDAISSSHAAQIIQNPTAVWAAMIGLVGVIWTGFTTIVGFEIKNSIDRRTIAIQVEAENRLKVETVIRIIDLMTAQKLSSEALRQRREAAILSLISIGNYSLAVSFANQFIEDESVSARFVVGVVDKILIHGDEASIVDAGRLLRNMRRKIAVDAGNVIFPRSFYMEWSLVPPSSVREHILSSLIFGMMYIPIKMWNTAAINRLIYTFYKVIIIENHAQTIMTAVFCAKSLINKMNSDGVGGGGFFPPDRGRISYVEISNAAVTRFGKIIDVDNQGTLAQGELMDLFEDWLGGADFSGGK